MPPTMLELPRDVIEKLTVATQITGKSLGEIVTYYIRHQRLRDLPAQWINVHRLNSLDHAEVAEAFYGPGAHEGGEGTGEAGQAGDG